MLALLVATVVSTSPAGEDRSALHLRTTEPRRAYEVSLAGLKDPACRVTDRHSCEAEVRPGRVQLRVNGALKQVTVAKGAYDLVLSNTDRTLAWVGLGFLAASPVLFYAGWSAAAGGSTGLGGVLTAAPLVTVPVGVLLAVWGLVAPGVEVKVERRFLPPAVSLQVGQGGWKLAAAATF